MPDDVVDFKSAQVVAVRLREGRLAIGLSTRAVATLLLSKFNAPVSHSTIANYEKESGRHSPPLTILAMLAEIYERPLEWFLQKSRPLTGIRYRYTSSRVLVKERHKFEAACQHWLEAYFNLERRIKDHLTATRKPSDFQSTDPVELAAAIRTSLKIQDRDPIFSVVRILESFGIRVIELATSSRIDGLAARFGDEGAVVLNPTTSNDRCRLNAAHELYHCLDGHCDDPGSGTKQMEDRAFEFASNLLIPESQLVKAFEGQSAIRLVQAKEHFGISMAAMIYRAEKRKIISERVAKKLWIQFAKRGWRANEPGTVRPDRAIRFESILDKAVAERSLTWSEAAKLMNVTRADIEERMRLAMGLTRFKEDIPEQKGGSFILKISDDFD